MENDEFDFEKEFNRIKAKLGDVSESELRDKFKQYLKRSQAKLLIEMDERGFHAELNGAHSSIVRMMVMMMEKNNQFKEMVEDAIDFFTQLDKKIKEN